MQIPGIVFQTLFHRHCRKRMNLKADVEDFMPSLGIEPKLRTPHSDHDVNAYRHYSIQDAKVNT